MTKPESTPAPDKDFKPAPLPAGPPKKRKGSKGKKKPAPKIDRYAQYLKAWKDSYTSHNLSVEGGRKPKKKNRRTGFNWTEHQRIYQAQKHNHRDGRRRRGNN